MQSVIVTHRLPQPLNDCYYLPYAAKPSAL